jgi:hypothetical protein
MNSFCRCRSSALSRAVARRRRRASGSGQEIPAGAGIRLRRPPGPAGLNLPGLTQQGTAVPADSIQHVGA